MVEQIDRASWCLLQTLSIARRFLPIPEEKVSVALGVTLVADDSKTAAERRFQRLAVVALHVSGETSVLGVLLPLVDGVRDSNTFNNFDWLSFTAEDTFHPVGAQPPFRI